MPPTAPSTSPVGTDDNTDMVETASAPAPTVAMGHHSETPVLELIDVSHEYGSGTPWADTGFARHQLRRARGRRRADPRPQRVRQIDAGMDHGRASPCRPSARACWTGLPSRTRWAAVAISFQAARLQLMRSHVALEIASAAGFSIYDQRRVSDALAMVGLDPTLASRRIDQLSGGQMRRVVLAGLLARSPRALILDEPLAGLDAASQRGLLRLLGGPATQRRADRGRDLTRLPRSGGAVSAHAAPGERRAGAARSRRREAGHDCAHRGPSGNARRSCCCGPFPVTVSSTGCGPARNFLWWRPSVCC